MDERKIQPEQREQANSAQFASYEETVFRSAREKVEAGRFEDAARIFSDALGKFENILSKGQKCALFSETAVLYFWLGDYETARVSAGRALTYDDKSDVALIVLGKLAVAQFKFPLARSFFTKVSADNPFRALGLALVCIKLRDKKGAQSFLGEARGKISPNDPEYRVLAAYLDMLEGAARPAVLIARELTKKCERDPSLMLLIGEIFMTAGNFGEARAIAEKVHAVCPENDHASALKAHAAYAEQDYGGAEDNAREAVRLNGFNAYAKTILMKCAVREGGYELAESIGLQILADSPEYSLGHANLGDVYFNSGRYELAQLEYGQTAELMDSQTKGALLRSARMKFIEGGYAAAAKMLEELIEGFHTYFDDAMCDLALCYDALGDEENRERVILKMQMRKGIYVRTEKLLKELSA